MAQSSTVFPIGPGLSVDEAIAITPYRLTRPYVGFNPTTPHQEAGCRIDPAVSVPIAATQRFAATEAALPPLEPPGEYFVFLGFFVVPKSLVSVLAPCAQASMLVFPKTTPPASFNFFVTVDS